MGRLVILKTGSKADSLADYPGDYEQWIAEGMGIEPARVDVRDLPAGAALPPPAAAGAVAITGSSAMVTERAPWMVETEAWLRQALAARIPILAICFGHQLLAQALGGEVDYNPRGTEVGTAILWRTAGAGADPLFGALPEQFAAQLTHRQAVTRLPAGARLLAASERDPNQAFAFGERAWGVQFHPEFNERIMRHYVARHSERLLAEGRDADAILAACRPTPESCALLKRFASLAGMH